MPVNPTILENYWRTIAELEKKRKSRIYSIIHNGDAPHICGPTFHSLLDARSEFERIDTLELLIHTGGGHPEVAYKVVRFLRDHCKKLNVIVPLWAKSAGTLMCLAGETIYLGELGELGPLDIQITDPAEKGLKQFSPLDEFKSMEFLLDYAAESVSLFTGLFFELSGMSYREALHEAGPSVAAMVRPLYEKIDPLEIGGYRRALAIGEQYAERLLAKHPNGEKIVEKLVWGYPAHDFVINYKEAAALGLPIQMLDKSDDRKLVSALRELMRYEVSLHGFNKVSAKKSARSKAAPKPKVRTVATSARPIPVPASTRGSKNGH